MPRALGRLVQRSDAAGALQLLGHVLALFATGVLVCSSSGMASLAAMALHGLVLVFLFAPLHECVHFTAFRTRALNRVVANLCAALLLLPPEYFRVFHLAHHKHTADPGRDPELLNWQPLTLPRYARRMSGMDYWVERIHTLSRHARGVFDEPFIPLARQRGLRREARAFIILYALVLAVSVVSGSALVLWLWVVPALLGQPWLRLFLLAEHTGCDQRADMLCNSRTTRTNPLMAWLCWNMCYHVEHHAYAAVPFHQLPRAHGYLRPVTRHLARGYWRVHRALISGFRWPRVGARGTSTFAQGF